MSRFFQFALFAAVVSIANWGCAPSDSSTPNDGTTTKKAKDQGHDHADADHADFDHADHAHAKTDHASDLGRTIQTAVVYCGKCGDVKGSETCCAASAAKCESCGKNAGSALCCVKLEGAVVGQDFCGKCGQVAGGDQCCKADAAKCEKCGLNQGAPLCCKLKPDVVAKTAP